MNGLIFQSRKPEAEKFTDWVTGEVLPQIRKTGRYSKDVSPWLSSDPSQWPPKDGNLKYTPWVAPITNDLVYKRLDVGVLEALNLLNPLIGRYRARKQHQYIAPGEAKQEFKCFLRECVGVMSSFSTYPAFLERWNQLHPKVNKIPKGVEFHFADDQTVWLPFDQGLVPAEK
jgi:hypothetical protein